MTREGSLRNGDGPAAVPQSEEGGGRVRLARALSMLGAASRREAERLIAEGRVVVDGQVVREPAFLVDPARATIAVDGRPLLKRRALRYVALHKPRGVVSTVRDPHASRTVISLVPSDVRLYPVGRLDKDSEGLILLTNDGDFANAVMHPRYGVEKEYRALVRGRLTRDEVEQLRRGVAIDGAICRPVAVEIERTAGDTAWVKLVLREGRKREVRRLLDAIHHPVLRLIRTRIGVVRLDHLPPGGYRDLSPWEVEQLMAAARAASGDRRRVAPPPSGAEANADAGGPGRARAGTGPAADPRSAEEAKPLVVAIDGPAGAGKTTVGVQLAERLGAKFVDTGLFYRVVTFLALERGIDPRDASALAALARGIEVRLPEREANGQVIVDDRTLGPELRSPEVDAHVSTVAGHPEVREALIEPQRRAIAGEKAVVAGRDIGTVIWPEAQVKVFLRATPDERARRRALQLGQTLPFEAVRASVDRRDELDRNRSVAPLEVAPDAVVIDTDGVPVEEVVEMIYRLVERTGAHNG